MDLKSLTNGYFGAFTLSSSFPLCAISLIEMMQIVIKDTCIKLYQKCNRIYKFITIYIHTSDKERRFLNTLEKVDVKKSSRNRINFR